MTEAATIKFVRESTLSLSTLAATALVAVATTSFACGGSSKQLQVQKNQHEQELAEVRAEARAERVKRRDLEKELALKRVQEKRAEATGGSSVHAERPDLPVVREAKTLSSEHELPDDYEIMGINSEGVEIVYVGEATSDKVIKIPPQHFSERDDYHYDDKPLRPSLRTARALRSVPVPATGDRLLVTKSVPTIDTQLRQARQVLPRSRARSLGDPRAEYKRYYDALRAGNHAYAVTGFRNFVQRFPRHDFADNSQYWLGEAFYDQKRYKSALVEFRKVVDNHPDGNKVPDALLKLGYCYHQIGEGEKARSVWQQIVRVYPKSNPASLAKTKLAER